MKIIKFLLENSVFLIFGTLSALLWANVDNESYVHTTHGPLHFAVNDILMCFFFGIAAKEIWEALLPGGALSSLKKAATPLMATLGGVLGPAGLYVGLALAFGAPELVRGWAVPTATDIAFSYLVAKLIFGARHPAIPFLLLLAIADDAVGLVILAVFYPAGQPDLVTFALCVVGALAFNLIVVRKLLGLRSFWAYLVVAGPVSWYGFHAGGIHPALALVPLVPTLPHAAEDAGLFVERSMDEEHRPKDALNQFEHFFKYPVEIILMLFGLVNAGVAFTSVGLATGLVDAALLVGKPVGIVVFTWIALKGFRLSLPEGMDMKDVTVVGTTAGIGFTVALFVCGVAFPPGDVLDAAKIGALGSFAAAGLAFVAARLLGVRRLEEAESDEVAGTPVAQEPEHVPG